MHREAPRLPGRGCEAMVSVRIFPKLWTSVGASITLWNNGQNQPRRRIGVVTYCLRGLYRCGFYCDDPAGVRIAVKSGVVAAGDFHAETMTFLENHAGWPQIDPDFGLPADTLWLVR